MFAALNSKHKPTPEMSPEWKPDLETLTSGNSNFESAKESPALKLTGRRESPDLRIELVEGKPHLETEQTRTEQTELIEGGPRFEFEETDEPLAESSYWTKPRPKQPYSPIKKLFAFIINLNQSTSVNTITMAQPANSPKELNLNKPDTFDGNREGFKKFLQDVKVNMDINHETYNNNLRKIAFILFFMMTGAAATWKAQFIEEAYAKPIPANPNDRLGTYTTFRKELIKAFSMFDSVGDALDKLQSLRKKKTNLIDEHIARFKMLATKSQIDTMNPLSIELFKETLPWALTL
jgi:Ty3 transposon capsid-like protein